MEKLGIISNCKENNDIKEGCESIRRFHRHQSFRSTALPTYLSSDVLTQATMEGAASSIPKQTTTDTISRVYNNDDFLIDMKYIVSKSGLTNKFFYAQIKRGLFPSPIKLGRSSRWKKSEFEQWIEERIAAR